MREQPWCGRCLDLRGSAVAGSSSCRSAAHHSDRMLSRVSFGRTVRIGGEGGKDVVRGGGRFAPGNLAVSTTWRLRVYRGT